MKYELLKNVISLLEEFESSLPKNPHHTYDIHGFRRWLIDSVQPEEVKPEPDWEGKENGRSAESVINTLIVHMNRYAKSYSKSAIVGSGFSSQEDFIYLINLKAFGAMSKMDLIRKNVHEKPVGMQIINRLIRKNWVTQSPSDGDRRIKLVSITSRGLEALENQMGKIRQATQIVTGDLTEEEKMELIRLLTKLDVFHQTIYDLQMEPRQLLEKAIRFSCLST